MNRDDKAAMAQKIRKQYVVKDEVEKDVDRLHKLDAKEILTLSEKIMDAE